MRMIRWSWSVQWAVALLILLGATTPAQTEKFSDSFHNTTLDATHWLVARINVQGEATPTAEGLRLSLSSRNRSRFFAITVWLNCRIPADFEAQVAYRLVDWPPASGIRLGLGVSPNRLALPLASTSLHGTTGDAAGLLVLISERISLRPEENSSQPNGGEFYLSEFNGWTNRFFPTLDRDGRLRITRLGNNFTSWYWDKGGRLWIPTGQWSLNPEVRYEGWVALQLWGHEESPKVSLLLEEFSLSAQGLSCP